MIKVYQSYFWFTIDQVPAHFKLPGFDGAFLARRTNMPFKERGSLSWRSFTALVLSVSSDNAASAQPKSSPLLLKRRSSFVSYALRSGLLLANSWLSFFLSLEAAEVCSPLKKMLSRFKMLSLLLPSNVDQRRIVRFEKKAPNAVNQITLAVICFGEVFVKEQIR